MKRLVIWGVALLIVASVVILLTQRSSSRTILLPVVTIPLEGDIQTLDPAALSDPITSRVVWQIYEGLIGLDAKNEVIPLLAESWQSVDDNRKWIFRIRPGVRFHSNPAFSGEQHTRNLNARDVVFSYERMARGFGSFLFQGLVDGFESYIKGGATTISGITATGEMEVTFSLTRSDPAFIYRITSPYLAIMPPEVVKSSGDQFGRSVAVGTGPFRLVQVNTTEVVLERNPHYWRPTSGNIHRLVFRVEKNPQLLAAGLRGDSYDLIQLPAEYRQQFLKDGSLLPIFTGKYKAFTGSTFNVHFLGMDIKQMTDATLRHAMSLAINRDSITSKLLSGGAITAQGPIPPGMQGYTSPIISLTDIVTAKREVAQSSYDGHELTFLVSNTPNHADAAQIIQNDLLQCGIKTRIELVDFNAFVTRLFSAERPPLFLAFSEWVLSAPELLMEQFKATAVPNPNLYGYTDRRVESLIDELGKTSDRAEINRLCGEIEKIVAKAPPAVWLYNVKQTFVGQKRLTNFTITGNNHWLLSELHSEP